MCLNRLDICMSHDQVIRDQVKAGKYHDSKVVLLWKKIVNLSTVSIVDSLLSTLHASANRIFAL